MTIPSLVGLIVLSSAIGAHILWKAESISTMWNIIEEAKNKEKEDNKEDNKENND